MMRRDVGETLIKLYANYCAALRAAEAAGRGNYTDADYESLGGFMAYVKNNLV